MICPY